MVDPLRFSTPAFRVTEKDFKRRFQKWSYLHLRSLLEIPISKESYKIKETEVSN